MIWFFYVINEKTLYKPILNVLFVFHLHFVFQKSLGRVPQIYHPLFLSLILEKSFFYTFTTYFLDKFISFTTLLDCLPLFFVVLHCLSLYELFVLPILEWYKCTNVTICIQVMKGLNHKSFWNLGPSAARK